MTFDKHSAHDILQSYIDVPRPQNSPLPHGSVPATSLPLLVRTQCAFFDLFILIELQYFCGLILCRRCLHKRYNVCLMPVRVFCCKDLLAQRRDCCAVNWALATKTNAVARSNECVFEEGRAQSSTTTIESEWGTPILHRQNVHLLRDSLCTNFDLNSFNVLNYTVGHMCIRFDREQKYYRLLADSILLRQCC